LESDDRLIEKFAVLGRDDIADQLEKKLPYILSEDANVEVLTMLLALSDQPVESLQFDEGKFTKEQVFSKVITWEEILAEEPLAGDHWKEPEYSESEDEDWVYEKETVSKIEPPLPEVVKKSAPENDSRELTLSLDFLKRQYWLHRHKHVVVRDGGASEFGLPGQSLLSRLMEEYDDQYYVFNEIDAIREVLFMLSGWDCILFTISKHSISVRIAFILLM